MTEISPANHRARTCIAVKILAKCERQGLSGVSDEVDRAGTRVERRATSYMSIVAHQFYSRDEFVSGEVERAAADAKEPADVTCPSSRAPGQVEAIVVVHDAVVHVQRAALVNDQALTICLRIRHRGAGGD